MIESGLSELEFSTIRNWEWSQ